MKLLLGRDERRQTEPCERIPLEDKARERGGEREENHNVLLLAVPLAGPPIFRIHTTEPTSIPILLSLYFFFAQRAITKMDREEEGRVHLHLLRRAMCIRTGGLATSPAMKLCAAFAPAV